MQKEAKSRQKAQQQQELDAIVREMEADTRRKQEEQAAQNFLKYRKARRRLGKGKGGKRPFKSADNILGGKSLPGNGPSTSPYQAWFGREGANAPRVKGWRPGGFRGSTWKPAVKSVTGKKSSKGKGKLGKHEAPCIATRFATPHSQRARNKIEN